MSGNSPEPLDKVTYVVPTASFLSAWCYAAGWCRRVFVWTPEGPCWVYEEPGRN